MKKGHFKKTVHVTVEIFQGIIQEVRLFKSQKQAELIEQEWLVKNDVLDEISREGKSQDGTEIKIFECRVE